jgi:uncharacterized protein YoxC
MPQYLIASLVVAILFLLSWGFIVYLLLQIRKLNSRLVFSEQTLSKIENKLNQIDDELHEIHTGSQALGRRVKELALSVSGLNERQQHLAEQDPQSRFYFNAVKLITEGASLEQVMHDCDLPRAEAELLFSLHKP